MYTNVLVVLSSLTTGDVFSFQSSIYTVFIISQLTTLLSEQMPWKQLEFIISS